jgi:hypothetical protein
MSGYTKLFESITDSTIWRAPDTTRLVWITMLAMADQHGYVGASVPGLADRAKVSLEACLTALECFLAPDEWSRSKEYDGRRIAEVDGGWLLLNHAKYRAARAADDRREYMRVLMAEKRLLAKVSNVSRGEPPLAKATPEATPEAYPKKEQRQQHAPQAARFDAFWRLYPVKKGKADAVKAWGKLKPSDDLANKILEKLQRQVEQDSDWIRGYAPHPATYLNGRRWEDAIAVGKPTQAPPASRRMQAINVLQELKNGLAQKRDSGRVPEVDLPLLGSPTRT